MDIYKSKTIAHASTSSNTTGLAAIVVEKSLAAMEARKVSAIGQTTLYPFRFEPIYQNRIWGGRRLGDLLSTPLPADATIGEAWLLSDRDDHASIVADGALKGQTIGQLLNQFPEEMLGKLAGRFRRFPLLLKFLDVRATLSVQVHPSDEQAKHLPAGEHGKTEAWVVLESGSKRKIYARLTPSTTTDDLRAAIANGSVTNHLESFTPEIGDCVFVKAGTVHSLSGLVVFELQENSDVTFRLYDWDHIDPKTGKHRALQVDQAMACIDFPQGAVSPVVPVVEETKPVLRERIFLCKQFGMWRIRGESPFSVGKVGMPRVLVCLDGEGRLEHAGAEYGFRKGDVLLLPAAVGKCLCRTRGAVSLLKISLPEGA